jgi:hypothetical protein
MKRDKEGVLEQTLTSCIYRRHGYKAEGRILGYVEKRREKTWELKPGAATGSMFCGSGGGTAGRRVFSVTGRAREGQRRAMRTQTETDRERENRCMLIRLKADFEPAA